MVPTMPFLFRDKEHMRKVLDGAIGDEILKDCESQGFVGLAFYDSGARSIYTAKKPVKTLADVIVREAEGGDGRLLRDGNQCGDAGDGAGQRNRQHQRKDRKAAHRKFTMAQLARPTRPSSITNAYP